MTERLLYLDRRSTIRIPFHASVRFVADPAHPLHLGEAVTQNVCLRGVQILTSAIPERQKTFDIWIPLVGDDVVPAKARTAWMRIEDTLGDNRYWLQTGLELLIEDPADRRRLAETIRRRAQAERTRSEPETSKVGFVF